jgi:hypothetical protein
MRANPNQQGQSMAGLKERRKDFMIISLPTTRTGASAENPAKIPIIIDQAAIDDANKVYLNFVSCLNSIGAEPSILARLHQMTKN